MTTEKTAPVLGRKELERAFELRDATYDGIFYVAVSTTGIFCRPSCPSRPKLENVEFFRTASGAVRAGYRPCLRCHPAGGIHEAPGWTAELMRKMESEPGRRIGAVELRRLGVTPERVRRWFVEHYGVTFAQWQRGWRLAGALKQIRSGSSIDDAVFDNGYGSHSGFREAFARAFGTPPGKAASGQFISAQLIETPLGPMLAAASGAGVCVLEFCDRRTLEDACQDIKKHFGLQVLPVGSDVLSQLRSQLEAYFARHLKQFTVPLDIRGTHFQKRAWEELRRIPHGKTICYEEQACRLGNPKAVRAVAQANGRNRISIIIPCHRVVGKDGELTGYGGGLWRKRLLLTLERTGKLPQDAED